MIYGKTCVVCKESFTTDNHSRTCCSRTCRKIRKSSNTAARNVKQGRANAKPEICDGIAYIVLTKGKIAVIDECDVDLVCRYSWYAQSAGKVPNITWHAVATIKGKNTAMHRLIMGEPEGPTHAG
jgi:hypothetical protein